MSANLPTVAYREDYGIGDNLNVSLNRMASPFTADSMTKLLEIFSEMRDKAIQTQSQLKSSQKQQAIVQQQAKQKQLELKEEQLPQTKNGNVVTTGTGVFDNVSDDPPIIKGATAYGDFTDSFSLIKSETQSTESLNVDGRLSASFGPVSGDASVQFAMNNTQSSLDLTIVYDAKKSGFNVKVNIDALNILQLTPEAQTLLKNGSTLNKNKPMTELNDIAPYYGIYLIVGAVYGGRLLFRTKYSTQSSSDKMSVAGALSVSYEEIGVKLQGSVNGSYSKSNINNSTNITTTNYVEPSVVSDDLTTIFGNLGKLSNPTGLDSKDSDLVSKTTELTQKYFDENVTKQPGSYVLVRLDTIQCISSTFTDNITGGKPDPTIEDTETISKVFFNFSNQLYPILKSMNDGLISMRNNWIRWKREGRTNEDINDNTTFELYLKYVPQTIEFMETFNTTTEIRSLCNDYEKYTKNLYKSQRTVPPEFKNLSPSSPSSSDNKQNDNINDDNTLEIEKYFAVIDINKLQQEYQRDILDTYDKIVENLSPFEEKDVWIIPRVAVIGDDIKIDKDNKNKLKGMAVGRQTLLSNNDNNYIGFEVSGVGAISYKTKLGMIIYENPQADNYNIGLLVPSNSNDYKFYTNITITANPPIITVADLITGVSLYDAILALYKSANGTGKTGPNGEKANILTVTPGSTKQNVSYMLYFVQKNATTINDDNNARFYVTYKMDDFYLNNQNDDNEQKDSDNDNDVVTTNKTNQSQSSPKNNSIKRKSKAFKLK